MVIVIRCFIRSDNGSRSGRQTPVPARFRCFGCGIWFKHNRRTKAAWRDGYRRMYCDQCHREWLDAHGPGDLEQEYGPRFIDGRDPDENYGFGNARWQTPEVPVVKDDPPQAKEPRIIVLKRVKDNSHKPKLRKRKQNNHAPNDRPKTDYTPADEIENHTPLSNISPDNEDLEQKRFERGCMLMIGIGVLIFAIVAYFHFFFPRR